MTVPVAHRSDCPGSRLSQTRPPVHRISGSLRYGRTAPDRQPALSVQHRVLPSRADNSCWHSQRAQLHVCRAADPAGASDPGEHKVDAVDELMQRVQDLAGPVREGLQGNSIYLVGMMGSGKSSVGKLLARVLEYPFLDSDTLIEQLTKTTVAEVFAQNGEEYFRELESSVLKELMPWKSTIVATGGGAVCKRENWALMQHAVVVWLHGKPSVLAHRAVADGTASRPLLGNETQEGDKQSQIEATARRLNALLTERAGMYAQADICVPIDSQEPHAVAGAGAAEVVYRILKGLEVKLKTTKLEREQMKNFQIDSVSGLPNANFLSPPG